MKEPLKEFLVAVFLVAALWCATFVVGSFIFALAWNGVVPDVLGMPCISMMDAFFILLLVWMIGQFFTVRYSKLVE